jgi:hypothetical protein
VREVYLSICQLFELFLLAVFRSFSDVPLADIVGETPTGSASQPQPSLPLPDEVSGCRVHSSLSRGRYWPHRRDGGACSGPKAKAGQSQGLLSCTAHATPRYMKLVQGAAADAVPRRLHAVLNRIANRSLAPYRAIILPPPPPPSGADQMLALLQLGTAARGSPDRGPGAHASICVIASMSMPVHMQRSSPLWPAAAGLAAAGQHLSSRAPSGSLGAISSAGSAAAVSAGGPGAESAAAAARQQRHGAGGSILWHSGNMYGMQVSCSALRLGVTGTRLDVQCASIARSCLEVWHQGHSSA